MRHLVMPLAYPGLQIHAHQAVGKQIIARTMAAILIRSRVLHRQIDQPQFFIHRDLRPDARVPIRFRRIVLPRVIPEFARPRNCIELPQLPAGLHVVGAHQTLGVIARNGLRAFLERRPHNHHILRHRRRCVQADFTGLQIDLFIESGYRPYLQVHQPAHAEPIDRRARLRVQLHETVTRGDENDAVVAFAICPIRQPAAR